MQLRRELILYLATLVLLNVALAFIATGLFARMGPVIALILTDNVPSMDAANEILAEFAAAPGPLSSEALTRAKAALARAEANITETTEKAPIASIRRLLQPAAAGDPAARAALIDAIQSLNVINRQAMSTVSDNARRLGSAGAWTAVFVGLASLALSLLIILQVRRRLILPVLELHDVLRGARQGDRFRRCRHLEAPIELKETIQSVNAILDERKELPPVR
jgi:methyl-accepting chemotaxis protein